MVCPPLIVPEVGLDEPSQGSVVTARSRFGVTPRGSSFSPFSTVLEPSELWSFPRIADGGQEAKIEGRVGQRQGDRSQTDPAASTSRNTHTQAKPASILGPAAPLAADHSTALALALALAPALACNFCHHDTLQTWSCVGVREERDRRAYPTAPLLPTSLPSLV